MRRVIIALALCCLIAAVTGSGQLEKRIGGGEDVGLVYTGTVTYDTVTVLIALKEVIAQNTDGAWDAADCVHSEWPQTAPDIVLADTIGEYLRAVNVTNGATGVQGEYLICEYADSASWPKDQDGSAGDPEELWLLQATLDTIPDGARLINVEVCGHVDFAYGMTGNGFVTLLTDTLPGDMLLWDVPQKAGTPVKRHLNSSWLYLNAATSVEWPDSLGGRTLFSNWGIQGTQYRSEIADESEFTFNVTDGTQYALDNDVYSGWWLRGHQPTSISRFRAKFHYDNEDAGNMTKQMFVKLTYVTKTSHVGPYPGGMQYAFVFTADDADTSNVTQYIPLFQMRGKRYQMFVSGYQLNEFVSCSEDNGNHPAYMDLAELAWAKASGVVDIGSHSRTHEYGYTGDLDGLADQESLSMELSPTWLADLLGVEDSDIKTFCWPNGHWSATAVAHMVANFPNYIGGRATSDDTSLQLFYYAKLDTSLITSETIEGGGIFVVDNNVNWDQVIQHGFDAETVAAAADSALASFTSFQPFVTLSHNVTANADSAQVGMLLDHLIARGDVWVCTFDELIEHYRSTHTQLNELEWDWPW